MVMVQKGIGSAASEVACILQLILEVFPSSHSIRVVLTSINGVILKEDWNSEFGVEGQRWGNENTISLKILKPNSNA